MDIGEGQCSVLHNVHFMSSAELDELLYSSESTMLVNLTEGHLDSAKLAQVFAKDGKIEGPKRFLQ